MKSPAQRTFSRIVLWLQSCTLPLVMAGWIAMNQYIEGGGGYEFGHLFLIAGMGMVCLYALAVSVWCWFAWRRKESSLAEWICIFLFGPVILSGMALLFFAR